MQTKPKTFALTTGMILYLLGAIVAFSLLALGIWGDIEARTLAGGQRSDELLRTLRCPIMITEDETGIISATFHNTTDRDVNPTVRASWTQGSVLSIQERSEKIEIPAGESRAYQFEITADDAAYNKLILVNIYQLENYSLPSRSATCGVVLLPVSGPTGQQVYLFMFGTGFVLIAAGLLLLKPKDKLSLTRLDPISKRARVRLKSLTFLGSCLLIGILLALLGNWLLSAGLMVLAVLTAAVIASNLASGSDE